MLSNYRVLLFGCFSGLILGTCKRAWAMYRMEIRYKLLRMNDENVLSFRHGAVYFLLWRGCVLVWKLVHREFYIRYSGLRILKIWLIKFHI